MPRRRFGQTAWAIRVWSSSPCSSTEPPRRGPFEREAARPRYEGTWHSHRADAPRDLVGGDFATPTDYLDPLIQQNLSRGDNFAALPLNRYHHSTINYFACEPSPARASRENLLGTDDRGRDLLARLLYGLRLSVVFALIVTAITSLIGTLYGAIQGYFAGWTDIAMERFNEIWSVMPKLYMLIILALISASFGLLLVLLSIFGWLGIADYVRAEFLRNRTLDYVAAARALGQSNWKIIRRHILPNSLTPVVTLIPFEMAAAIGALTSLDFSGSACRREHRASASFQPGQEQPRRLVDLTFHLRRPGRDAAASHPGRRRAAGRSRSQKGIEGGRSVSLLEVKDLSIDFGSPPGGAQRLVHPRMRARSSRSWANRLPARPSPRFPLCG